MSTVADRLAARVEAVELEVGELRAALEAPPAPLQAPPPAAGPSCQVEDLARRVEALEGTVGRLAGLLVEAVARTLAARVSLLDAAPAPRRRVAEVNPGQVEERSEAEAPAGGRGATGDRPTNAERNARKLAAAQARALAAGEEPPATVSALRAARRRAAAAKGESNG